MKCPSFFRKFKDFVALIITLKSSKLLFFNKKNAIDAATAKGINRVIIYDLRCKKNHSFEGWFNNRSAFEEQKSQKLLSCPICGETNVEMVPTSISIMYKDREPVREQAKEASPIKALQMLHQFLDKNFEDVGDKFAEVAMKIHDGEEDKRNIKGTTTREQDEILKEKGIHFVKVPVPKFDS
jgi:hypothetical protein